MTMIRTHIGVSLDGFAASADGRPTWDFMPTFGAGTHGYTELMDQCGAVAMGRTCFDQGLEGWLGGWPWGERPIFVLTSRPLPENAPPIVSASQGGAAGLAGQIASADIEGDIQLLGGPGAMRAFLAAGVLDRLGIVVLPVLLGSGIPLFDIAPVAFSEEAWSASQADPPPNSALAQFELESQ